jgi:hypothetical protein
MIKVPDVLDKLVNRSGDYQIGIVGSPSDTVEIVIDILQTQEKSKILGQLVYLVVPQEDRHLAVIGQISQIETKNRWHEDQTFRGIIKRRGRLPHLSERADVRTATISVQATFEFAESDMEGITEGILATSPSTGAVVFRVRDEILDTLLLKHKSEVVYLGRAYSTSVRMPFWLKHFGNGGGGAGEAYHIGVFGKTGSGKSGLAAYLLLGYARHQEMGILFIDPQGQFTNDKDLPFDLHSRLGLIGREVRTYSISKGVRLPNNHSLFVKLLERTNFYRWIGVKGNPYTEYMAEEVKNKIEAMLKSGNAKLESPPADLLQRILVALKDDSNALDRVYAKGQARSRLQNSLEEFLANSERFEELSNKAWQPVLDLFLEKDSQGNSRTSLNWIIRQVIGVGTATRPVIFIDISGTGTSLVDDDETKALLLREIVSSLTWQGEKAFKEDKKLNCIVAVDEAHRFASRTSRTEDEGDISNLSRNFVKGVRETRKYGLGYMFITQTLASLHPEVLGQLRVKFFGHGLNMGQELVKLKEEIGSDSKALSLYTSFTDPASSTKKQFPFMVIGPASPLSFTGAPLFFQTFTEFEKEFIVANKFFRGG